MLLARIEGVHLVGTAHDGESAVRMAEALEPNLVLLDIAMPGLDGIEVARALSRSGESPAVVFVTAFDQFAVAAFDVAAIDYLMKPVEAERLARSIERARAYLDARADRAPDEVPGRAGIALARGVLGIGPVGPGPHRRPRYRPGHRRT